MAELPVAKPLLEQILDEMSAELENRRALDPHVVHALKELLRDGDQSTVPEIISLVRPARGVDHEANGA